MKEKEAEDVMENQVFGVIETKQKETENVMDSIAFDKVLLLSVHKNSHRRNRYAYALPISSMMYDRLHGKTSKSLMSFAQKPTRWRPIVLSVKDMIKRLVQPYFQSAQPLSTREAPSTSWGKDRLNE